jgi:DNA-directed RNA polymerase specialized sigma24 family protein
MVHEPPGFRGFVEARYSSLVRFGTLLCGDLARGEDLAQAGIVRTLRAWPRLGLGVGDPEGHTRTVMAQEAWRSGGPSADQQPDPAHAAALGATDDPAAAIRDVLVTLPAQQRVVLVLGCWTDLTEAEIAAELRCSTGTVRNRAARAVAALRSGGLIEESGVRGSLDEGTQVQRLLSRAADVVPASTRPTDDVLDRADRAPSSWLRRHRLVAAGGLLAAALLVGSVVALSGGDDQEDPPPPKPLRLTVDLPAGWRYDDSGLALTCTSSLQGRTVYRRATIGDLRCPAGQGPTVDGPVLVTGRLDPTLAERVRTSGSPSTIGNRPGWVEPGGDSPYAFATYLVGGSDDLGYVVLAPHDSGPEEPVVPSLQGEDVWPVPVAALAAGSGVGVHGGDKPSPHVLPTAVRAVVLSTEPRSTGAAPGAKIWTEDGVREILRELRPAKRSEAPCDRPISARSLWLQREAGSWVRVDVTRDAAGCRAAVSELGGGARVAGDPVAMARVIDEGEPRTQIDGDSEVVNRAGLSFVVPVGWQVTDDEGFDPCTATVPTVVLADGLSPSCLHGLGQRPSQPYLWITSQPLEDMRLRTAGGVPLPGPSRRVHGRDGVPIRWSEERVDVDGAVLEGRLGVPPEGSGRLLLVGVQWVEGATKLQKLVAST